MFIVFYRGAVYHVMAPGQGNGGQKVFRDGKDWRCVLEAFREACERAGWEIHARLGMGHYSRVTQAVREMRVAPEGWLRQICRKLEHLAKDDE